MISSMRSTWKVAGESLLTLIPLSVTILFAFWAPNAGTAFFDRPDIYYVLFLGLFGGVISLISASLWPVSMFLAASVYLDVMAFDVARCEGRTAFIPESWVVTLLLPGAAYGLGLTAIVLSATIWRKSPGTLKLSALSCVMALCICLPIFHSLEHHEDRLLAAGCEVLD